jgi:hypothetical protein
MRKDYESLAATARDELRRGKADTRVCEVPTHSAEAATGPGK